MEEQNYNIPSVSIEKIKFNDGTTIECDFTKKFCVITLK